ncbi:hypothetical protein BDV12DRAFT_199801 [Aspergillus spectabilis]
MPLLLHSFVETFGMDPLPVDKNSLAWHLRATWIQQALADPCAFHTTIYAASAHLDAFRGTSNNRMTLYHHTIALQLLNERIMEPGAVFNESIMACVAPLSLAQDKVSSQIHKKALLQMIKAKGGLEHLALGPFLAGLIVICVVTDAVINDTQLDVPFLDIPPTSLDPPPYLISAILHRAESKIGYYNLSPEAIRIFKDIELVSEYHTDSMLTNNSLECLLASEIHRSWRADLGTTLLFPHTTEETPIATTEAAAITQSCHAAALIFFYLLSLDAPLPTTTTCLSPPEILYLLVNNLKSSLSRASMDSWVRTAPEAHSWVCMLGAAASMDHSDKVFFSLRHGQPVICVRGQGASVFLESWRMFEWGSLRRRVLVAGCEGGGEGEYGEGEGGFC